MPPITSISSVPPDFTGPESRARDRQRLASEVVGQAQRALGLRAAAQPQLTAAELQVDAAAQAARQQARLRPALDLVQRFFTDRQAALRTAALQRDEVLQQQDSDQQLRPIAQAQREADRLQVLRDAQLLETQRLAAQRLDPERLLAQRETQRLDAQRAQEQRTFARRDAERLAQQRLQEQEDAALLEERRLEEEREAERLQASEESERLDAERLQAREETERLEVERLQAREAERVEARRAATLTEQARVEEQRRKEQLEAAELEEQQLDQIQAERARAEQVDAEARRAEAQQRVPADSERVLVERAALAYRSESDRAIADATRFEASQPLSEQLRIARERLDALEAQRIDRVDVSSAALSRLAF